MEPSMAVMTGAALLLVVSRVNIVEMLEHEIEWPTLIFFMMLFIIVAGAEETRLIQMIADRVKEVSGGSLVVAILMILWVSAISALAPTWSQWGWQRERVITYPSWNTRGWPFRP